MMKKKLDTVPKKIFVVSGLLVALGITYWIGVSVGAQSGQGGSDEIHAHTTDNKTMWTCSMHPQIQLPEPGKCPICFMDLIPLETDNSGSESSGPVRLSMTENAKVLAGIATVPAVRRNIHADIRLTGKVAIDETRMELITARVAGRIDRLYVDYTGIPVQSGDHLARIYSPELVSLQRELLEAARVMDNADGMLKRSSERTFEASKEKLRLLGFSDQELERILARSAPGDHMTIRAGRRGVVIKKPVKKGAYVSEGTPLFHVADLSTVWLLLDAYESDLAWLRLGQNVEFSVEAFPGESFQGSISFIGPVVDPSARTVDVRVIVDNNDRRLKPDMFVRANVKAAVSRSGAVASTSLRGKWISPMHPQIVKDKPGTCDICGMPLVRAEDLGYVTSGFENVEPLVIPATAPLYTGERSIVYVEVPGAEMPAYEARIVELGPGVGDYYIVKSGITEGEKVVVEGAFKIDSELQIRAKPSMMNPAHESGHIKHVSRKTSRTNTETVQMPDI
ncbi:MAG: HlyD family efflux transporter periplasmic adaptor subunit, partial [Chitinivibrionales bacterium]|nr:HlyD family efflux transporter periplasmic adaptor subunit [Chitinivibrionales bacterium]